MDLYLTLKSIHIIAVISWMAGLLYLPRLFVYHANAPVGGELCETLKVMERKLLRYIMNPAMIIVWIAGIWLMFELDALRDGWMHAKLSCVILMTGLHHVMAAQRKRFARDENKKSAKYYRWFNEAPTLLMIAIVVLVVAKPF